jgi:hypothetical protein
MDHFRSPRHPFDLDVFLMYWSDAMRTLYLQMFASHAPTLPQKVSRASSEKRP